MSYKFLLLQDFISSSPYCLQYNSYDVRSKNLVLDGPIISCLYCFGIVRRNSVLVTHMSERVKNDKNQVIPQLEIIQVLTTISGVMSHA